MAGETRCFLGLHLGRQPGQRLREPRQEVSIGFLRVLQHCDQGVILARRTVYAGNSGFVPMAARSPLASRLSALSTDAAVWNHWSITSSLTLALEGSNSASSHKAVNSSEEMLSLSETPMVCT